MRKAAVATAVMTILALSAAGLEGRPAAARDETGASQALAPEIVSDLQRSLNSKGYHAGAVDGVFGAATRDAIAAFQHDNSLPGAGQIDQQTLAALGITGVPGGSRTARTAGPPNQTLSAPMVAEVQNELQRLGYDAGRRDGVWSPQTRRALTEFQHDRALPQTGRIDRGTLAALEAGGVPQTSQLPPPGRR